MLVARAPAAAAPAWPAARRRRRACARRAPGCSAAAAGSAATTSDFHIRQAGGATELLDLSRSAWLRAEAYYEDRSVGRFKASFIKQYAEQHLWALKKQHAGPAPLCVTLVATQQDETAGGGGGGAPAPQAGASSCLGTLDVRLLDPERVMGARWPDGVPLTQQPEAAYVSNVVVTPAQRGRGLGRALVAAAAALAADTWAVRRLYCHVEVDNEAALRLYTSSGFGQLGEPMGPAEEGSGPRLLLCRDCCAER